jgi:hypothetical protein
MYQSKAQVFPLHMTLLPALTGMEDIDQYGAVARQNRGRFSQIVIHEPDLKHSLPVVHI